MKTVFMGTPEFAVPILKAIFDSEHSVDYVVTQPDKPKGRGLRETMSPVKLFALKNDCNVLQPTNAREEEFIDTIKRISPDLIVTAAYGHILPQELLNVPGLGCINVHASLLPQYRGASPIQYAIMKGETITGISVIFMDAGMDTGDIILQLPISILHDENSLQLHNRLSQLGSDATKQVLAMFEKDQVHPMPQDHSKATYSKKLNTIMGKIDWTSSASDIRNLIRALSPWTSVYGNLNGIRINIHRAKVVEFEGNYNPGYIVACDNINGLIVACGKGFLRLSEIQKSGGKVLGDAEFIRGFKLIPKHSYFEVNE